MKDKIKILFTAFSGYPTQNSGGPNKIIYEIIKNLDTNNVEVSYLSFNTYINKFDHQNNLFQVKDPIALKTKITNYLFHRNYLYRFVTTSTTYLKIHYKRRDKYFQKFALKNDWDIIHAHDTMSMYYFRNYKGEKILSIHSKGTLRDEILDSQKNNKYIMKNLDKYSNRELEAIKMADSIIFPANMARENFFKKNDTLGIYSGKSFVIYNGIDVGYINSIGSSADVFQKLNIDPLKYEKIIVNVAALVKAKNVDRIIHAMNYIVNQKKMNYLYVHVGAGPELNSISQLIKKLKLNHYVRIIPFLSNGETISLIKSSDVFAMASERVVFDIVVLEALACGITIVVTDDGGNKEIIKHNENGLLYKPDDLDDFVKLLITSQKSQFSERAMETARNFSSQIMTGRYIKLYLND